MFYCPCAIDSETRGREKSIACCLAIINPRRACTVRVTVLGLCVCLCVSVRSGTTGIKQAYERYVPSPSSPIMSSITLIFCSTKSVAFP